MEPLTSTTGTRPAWIGHAALLVLVATAPSWLPNSFEFFNAQVLALYLVGAMGLNLLFTCGVLSIATSAFYLLGGYGLAVLTVTHGWSFWVALPVVTLGCGLLGFGLSVPAARLGHFTFAMVTFGYSIIAGGLAFSLSDITKGAVGISPVRHPEPFGTADTYFWLVAAALVLTYVVTHNMLRSPFGRASRASGLHPQASQAIGVEPFRVQAISFAASGAFAGLAGALYVPLLGFITPEVFSSHFGVLVLLMVALGGPGTVGGALLGGVFLFRLPIEIQRYSSDPGQISLVIYGVLLVVAVHFVPKGLAGSWYSLRGWIGRRLGRGAAAAEVRARGEASIEVALPSTAAREPGREVLRIAGASKNLGGVQALGGVELSLLAGTVHAVIGPNGAGKTTLLNTVSGFVPLDQGSLVVDGATVTGQRPAARARGGLARTFQVPLLFDEMTCLANVMVAVDIGRRRSLIAYVLRTPGARREERACKARAELLLASVGLAHRAAQAPAALPPGERRLLEIARVLALDPGIVLMDEPAAGLSESEIEELTTIIGRLRDRGIAVLLVEHHVEMVLEVADTITVLDYGEVIACGPPDDVVADRRVQEAYLGVEAVAAT